MIGHEPEVEVPNAATGCGLGQGAACCAYLTVSGVGLTCEARTSLGDVIERRVAEGSMTSRYLPELEFPACQEQRS